MVVIEMNPRVSRSAPWPRRRRASRSPRSPPSWPSAIGCTNCPTTSRGRRRPVSNRRSTTWSPRSRGSPSRNSPRPIATLTTQMKSVGETMAIGRTFKESFQKALRGLEVGSFGFGCDGKDLWGTPEQPDEDEIRAKLATPNAERVWYLRYALKSGMSIDEIYRLDRHRSVVPRSPGGDRRDGRPARGRSPTWPTWTTPRSARPSNSASPTGSWPRIWNCGEMEVRERAQVARHRGHVQVGRHLCRRVRSLHALLLFDLRRRGRNAAQAGPARSGS